MGSPVSHNVTQHPRLNSSLIRDLYLPIDNPKQSNDQDRFNNTQISQILRLLKTCIHLYKKTAMQSDQILPKYMFQNDIIEFKNEKILGKLRECTRLYQELNEFKLQSKVQMHKSSSQKEHLLSERAQKLSRGRGMIASITAANQRVCRTPSLLRY